MPRLAFDLESWLSPADGDDEVRATTGGLRVAVGDLMVTEVDDTIARTVRPHVNVPLVYLAEWLIANWWRLRWEPGREAPTLGWREAHAMASIGKGYAWPNLQIFSDGEFVHLVMQAEQSPDVAAIRYLRSGSWDVPAFEFEAAVDRLADLVDDRLTQLVPHRTDFQELRAELADERRDPSVARTCRWQALAGIDPGEADDRWLTAAAHLADDVGPRAGEEVMSVVPELAGGMNAATQIIDAMKRSSTTVDLSAAREDKDAVASPASGSSLPEVPWQRGARLAAEMRARHGLGTERVSNEVLGELLGTTLPLEGQPSRVALGGGFRNGIAGGRTRIVFGSRRIESQRFYLARLLAAAHVLGADEHLVPVTAGDTALQKVERSFAQELLCPWSALDAYTDEHGLDDDDLEDAATHFQVSELLVRTTLVNHGKVSRRRLLQAASPEDGR